MSRTINDYELTVCFEVYMFLIKFIVLGMCIAPILILCDSFGSDSIIAYTGIIVSSIIAICYERQERYFLEMTKKIHCTI